MINAPIFLSAIDNQDFIGTDSGASKRRDDYRQCMSGEFIASANAETHRR
jgi:hypothetical protein